MSWISKASNVITVQALKREAALRIIVERPLRTEIQSLHELQASKDRDIRALDNQLKMMQEGLAQEEEAKIRLQGKLYEQLERNSDLEKVIAENERDILRHKDTAQRATNSKEAAQRTCEEMISIVASLRKQCEFLEVHLAKTEREGKDWHMRAQACSLSVQGV